MLDTYVKSLDFVGLTFDAALRKLVSFCGLPQGRPEIDRTSLFDKFAERYCEQNEHFLEGWVESEGAPSRYRAVGSEVASSLARSLIHLNANAHGRNEEEPRIQKDEFVARNLHPLLPRHLQQE